MTSPPVAGGTVQTISTTSMNLLLALLRDQLLSYKSTSGTSARDSIGEKLYHGRAPDGTEPKFPYAIMRLSLSNDGENFGMRLRGELEVQVFGRPYTMQKAVNDLCDLFDQAMLGFVKTTSGLVFAKGKLRQPLPAASGEPLDGEVVAVRLLYTLVIWPTYLTSLTRVL